MTGSGYKPHIEDFIRARGNAEIFVQADIDSYFAEIKKADDRKPQDQRESQAKK